MEAIDVIVERGIVKFKGEARRLILMGAIKFDGVKIESNIEVEKIPDLITVGKGKFPLPTI